jgi:RNA polymerase sigma-70 factor (ECF subfamily)
MILEESTNNIEFSDEEVLARSVREPRAFSLILERYQDAFLRKAEGILRSKEDAEDVVQEAFTKIYLNAARFKTVPGATFKSWAYRILVNTALTRYQVLKRKRTLTADLDPEYYEMLPDQTNEGEVHEIRDSVISVLSRMPNHMARALRLHIIERRPQEEVAAMEGITVGALKTRIHRAKKEFRTIAQGIGL